MDTRHLLRAGPNEVLEICYTCPGHATVAANNHRAREGVDCVWVVDEADPQILEVLPKGVMLWVLPFDRSGSLNGWECMEGMLAVSTRAFELGYKSVLKRDSDTRILRDDMMLARPNGEAALFVNRGAVPRHRGWGAAYTIHAEALPILREGVEFRDYSEIDIPEDLFHSWTLRKVSRMLPIMAGKFALSPGYPEWEHGVAWVNTGNRMPFPARKEAYWRAWPDRTK